MDGLWGIAKDIINVNDCDLGSWLARDIWLEVCISANAPLQHEYRLRSMGEFTCLQAVERLIFAFWDITLDYHLWK